MSGQPLPVTANDPLLADALAAARPASLWRDTIGGILRQIYGERGDGNEKPAESEEDTSD